MAAAAAKTGFSPKPHDHGAAARRGWWKGTPTCTPCNVLETLKGLGVPYDSEQVSPPHH